MDNIIIENIKGKLLVSSREVEEHFGKEHRHVLEGIDSLVLGVAEKLADLFIETEYIHEQNKYTTKGTEVLVKYKIKMELKE